MKKLVLKQTVTNSCSQMGSLVTLPRYTKTIKQNITPQGPRRRKWRSWYWSKTVTISCRQNLLPQNLMGSIVTLPRYTTTKNTKRYHILRNEKTWTQCLNLFLCQRICAVQTTPSTEKEFWAKVKPARYVYFLSSWPLQTIWNKDDP